MKTASLEIRYTASIAMCALAVIFLPPPAFSASRHHDAHQHGVSKLNLVTEGKRLEMELESPGSDIVGFEHAPATDADRKAIADATARLKDGGTLFATSAAAGCKLQSAEIEAPGTAEKEEHHGQGHDHDHSKDKHGHHDDKAEAGTHSEFHAHYQFVCDRPEKLTHIDAKFFAAFPRAQKIDVQGVTPEKQFRQELTAGNSRLTL